MKCIACGDLTIDYSIVEQFVMNVEKKYGVSVVAIGYDRYNCLSSAQKTGTTPLARPKNAKKQA